MADSCERELWENVAKNIVGNFWLISGSYETGKRSVEEIPCRWLNNVKIGDPSHVHQVGSRL